MHTYTQSHAHTHSYMPPHPHAPTVTCTHTQTQAHTQAYTHTHTRTYSHMHPQTRTLTLTNSTHAQLSTLSSTVKRPCVIKRFHSYPTFLTETFPSRERGAYECPLHPANTSAFMLATAAFCVISVHQPRTRLTLGKADPCSSKELCGSCCLTGAIGRAHV